MQNNYSIRNALFLIFAVSGFTGLIYESIWTQYLKLVLGHAAHSQTLVLALFMGGMAIGAWLVSKRSKRIAKPVLLYAVIELAIGLLAVIFHEVFLASQQLLYSSILPGIENPQVATSIRWLWAAMLILPQSIMLGATFPLMSAGIVRLFPRQTGSILAMLYFTNSIGAAIGVLFSGFVLIDLVGLPGTILTAGLLNIFLAFFVWFITRKQPEVTTTETAEEKATSSISFPHSRIILLASFLTGLASFFYEIAWIRMLNLVLGTTTQSFELMLSAFIAGLAFGGLWIRNRIDKIDNIIQFVGYVQIIMGMFAIYTILLYNSTFDMMHLMMEALNRNESGYMLFMLSSHLIAFLIMVPTTFMAGMTLPLFTYSYMQAGHGEKGIGRIYAMNTLGSITGILLAVHLIMPLLGLKNLIALGSLVDILLGITLLYLAYNKTISRKLATTITVVLCFFVLTNILAEFDEGKMASGVYRDGNFAAKSEYIAFQKDGKTSTVVVLEVEQKAQDHVLLSILTNGKPDASVIFDDVNYAKDEPTQALAATLPLSAHPDIKTAAVIGMGSGMTSNTLLRTDSLEVVDTIEIEEAMVEGAKYFKQYSELVFNDPRSHIHIDDAKSFFSVNNKSYDLIISEPSNPWVSGVANLFSKEFYNHIKGHLNEGGIFTQWLQVYETDLKLVASVFKALKSEFNHFAVYQAGESDMMIIASQDDRIYNLDPWVFSQPRLTPYLSRLKLESTNDLYARRIGTDRSLGPFFQYIYPETQANSDFFPVLNRHSPKARFLRQDSLALLNLPYDHLPIMDFIDPIPVNGSRYNINVDASFSPSQQQEKTIHLFDYVVHAKPLASGQFNNDTIVSVRDIQLFMKNCLITDSLDHSFMHLAKQINVYLPAQESYEFWQLVINHQCYEKLSAGSRNFINLYQAVGARDSAAMLNSIADIFSKDPGQAALKQKQTEYVYVAVLSAYLQQDRVNEAKQIALNNLQKQGLDLSVHLLHSLISQAAVEIR